MRRGHGIGAIKNKNLAQAKFKDKGTEIAEDQFSQMAKQMEKFRENLEDFAAKHKEDIRKDANFRVQFQEMCASIGVDPLASSKGFWAEMLGVGDFYYELGVQIVEVCLATSHRNGDTQKTAASIKKTKRGEMQKDRFQEINTVQMVVGSDPQKNIKIYGLVGVEELRERLVRSRGKKSQDISIDDLLRAIKKLKVLGNGFTVIPLGGTYLIQSVPGELSMDHTTLLTQAQEAGFVTKSQLLSKLKWEEERANRALDYMVKEGLAWVDRQAKQETEYWFPSFFPDTSLQSPT